MDTVSYVGIVALYFASDSRISRRCSDSGKCISSRRRDGSSASNAVVVVVAVAVAVAVDAGVRSSRSRWLLLLPVLSLGLQGLFESLCQWMVQRLPQIRQGMSWDPAPACSSIAPAKP